MLWNLFGLQRKLDALFDEAWIRLGVDTVEDTQWHLGEWLEEATTPRMHCSGEAVVAA